jgi:DNA-binding transcriptional regulator YhcF (GntR family)
MEMSSTTSKKSNTREPRPKTTWTKSTDQERQEIGLFLQHRMKAGGSLPPGTINEAAEHFGRHRHTIERIYKELKQKSVHERQRFTTEQERQEIGLFLSQRMKAGGSLFPDTINEAAQHFGRDRRTIERIYKELKPISSTERFTRDQEREEIVLFLRHRMNARGSLPYGTINEAAQHFGRHRHTISLIYNELKPKSLKQRFTTDQERQDIVLFLRQRMSAGGSLPSDTINEAAQHFGRHRRTIERISKELKPNSVQDRGH